MPGLKCPTPKAEPPKVSLSMRQRPACASRAIVDVASRQFRMTVRNRNSAAIVARSPNRKLLGAQNRAVKRDGQTLDCLLSGHRDETAVLKVFAKASVQNPLPRARAIETSGANSMGLRGMNTVLKGVGPSRGIRVRRSKHLGSTAKQPQTSDQAHKGRKTIPPPAPALDRIKRCTRPGKTDCGERPSKIVASPAA